MLKSSIKMCKEIISILLILSLIISFNPFEAVVSAANADNTTVIFEDDFNRSDRDIHQDNNWYSVWTGDGLNSSHKIVSNQLSVHDYSNGGDNFSIRPTTESTLNQKVSVDIVNMDKLFNYATANVYLRFKKSNNYSVNSDCGYSVVVSNEKILLRRDGNKWDKSKLTNGGEAVTYSYDYGHVYRVEFTAMGTNPTVLSATLYDVTAGNVAVAYVEGSDDTSYLQSAATTALGVTKNQAGQTTAVYDNFRTEKINKILVYDGFDRADGSVGNSWVIGSRANAVISSKSLKLKTVRSGNDYLPHIAQAAVMRPMSEATLNQVVYADFCSASTVSGGQEGIWADQGGALIARCQDEKASDTNCYRFYAGFGYDGAGNWRTPVFLYNSKGELIYNSYISRASNAKYRLWMEVVSINEIETRITVKIFDLGTDGTVTDTALEATVTDDDENLQQAGTVGVSMYDRWGGAVKIDNFNYKSSDELTVPDLYNFLNLENGYTYKNNYQVIADDNALNGKYVGKIGDTVYSDYDEIGRKLDDNGTFVAFAVNAQKSGKYPIKLRLRFGCDNVSDYDNFVTANGNPCATAIINGSTYKFNGSLNCNEFFTTDAVYASFNEGLNVIYLMSPTIDISNGIDGVYIDYDCLFAGKGISNLEGTLVLLGDVNNDKTADVLDIVRVKRYLADNPVSINRFSADIDSTNAIDSVDLASLRKIIIKSGLDDENVNSLSWLKFLDCGTINPIALITEESGGADDVAEAMREEIENSEDTLSATGTTYYISPNGNDYANGKTPQTAWKTLNKLTNSSYRLKSGDVVLFERGSVFRQENKVNSATHKNNCVSAVSGVKYGAYGEGPKPAFYGSSFNYATSNWEKSADNIWKTALPLQDAGIIVFDNGSSVGIKKNSIDALISGNDFYHDEENGILYLYSQLGNPSDTYKSIEIGCDRPIFLFCGGVGNVVVENLDIRYSGAHAISGYESNHNIVIRNCEISWVGGSLQPNTNGVRYGNAVQFWDSCNAITIESCLIEQVYDAGLTFQGSNNSQYENIFFKNNLIRYCNYSVEFFISKAADGSNNGLMSNIDIMGNIMQYAGYGLCEQRPSKKDSAHICGWETDIGGNIKDFCIKDNIFDLAAFNIINWRWATHNGVIVSDNSYFMKNSVSDVAMYYGINPEIEALDQSTLENAVNVFDSSPKAVTWIIE